MPCPRTYPSPEPIVLCVASPCDAHVVGLVELAGCPVTVSGFLFASWRIQRAFCVISVGMAARLFWRCAATRHAVEQYRA